MSKIHQHTLDNGLKLVAEPIEGVQSLAMTLLIPAGAGAQPDNQQGVSAILSEMVCRGAGGKLSQEHSNALDNLGVQRSVSTQSRYIRLGATMISSKLDSALPLLFDMVTAPNLDKDSLEPSRELSVQQINSLADVPQQRAMLEIRKLHFPDPLGRSPLGERGDLEKLSLAQVQDFWQKNFVPSGSILAFAGNFNWNHLKNSVNNLLKNWQGEGETITPTEKTSGIYQHIEAKTSQVHIALAYDAPPEPDEKSKYQRITAALLSGGMSGRLFTEVREKRGLCYAVSAGYLGQKDIGAMMGYAGTTTKRAQETLDVFIEQLHRLSEGADENEFNRAITGRKSRLVMQGESTSARASTIASDLHLYGRPRTLDQMEQEVESVHLNDLNKYLKNNVAPAANKMTIVTIGPQPLKISSST